jgi:hypothetical protein
VARSGPERGGEGAEQIESAVREIERYLHAHPNASDTLEGVRDWWLAALGRLLSVDVIQAALDRLVESRVVEARPIPGGVVYGAVKHRDAT